MIVKFYGVRGSYPTPGKSFSRYGGNTPCVLIRDGGKIIIFDGGTGIIEVGKELVKENVSEIYIFISHSHYDHILGLPFFKPFFYEDRRKIKIFGPKFLEKSYDEVLERFLSSPFIPFSLKELKGRDSIEIITLEENENIYIFKNSIVKSIHSKNHPLQGVHLFSYLSGSKKITYMTDIKVDDKIVKEVVAFAKDSDVLIFDSFFLKREYAGKGENKRFGHSSFEDALKIKKLSSSKSLYFFHYNPDYDDKVLDTVKRKFEKNGAFLSYEGLEVNLND